MSGIDFHQTGMGAKFFNGQLPKMIRALEKIGDELEKVNASSEVDLKQLESFLDAVHYKDLLTDLIEYLCVAEKPKHVIEILYKHGFEKSDLLEFSFSEEDIDEVIEEVDNECDEE